LANLCGTSVCLESAWLDALAYFLRKGAGMINLFDFLLGFATGWILIFLWGFYKAWWEDRHE